MSLSAYPWVGCELLRGEQGQLPSQSLNKQCLLFKLSHPTSSRVPLQVLLVCKSYPCTQGSSPVLSIHMFHVRKHGNPQGCGCVTSQFQLVSWSSFLESTFGKVCAWPCEDLRTLDLGYWVIHNLIHCPPHWRDMSFSSLQQHRTELQICQVLKSCMILPWNGPWNGWSSHPRMTLLQGQHTW